MGKIVVATYVTLDGVMETPSWTMNFWDDELSDYQDSAQKEATAMLLGRVTFEQFASVWPKSEDEGAPFMNDTIKFVPTTTLSEEYWQARFLKQNVVQEIERLREKHNLLVYGSATLTRFLFDHGLVDEFREMVMPIVLGSGKRLFEGKGKPFSFRKLESHKTEKNVLLNTYTK